MQNIGTFRERRQNVQRTESLISSCSTRKDLSSSTSGLTTESLLERGSTCRHLCSISNFRRTLRHDVHVCIITPTT